VSGLVTAWLALLVTAPAAAEAAADTSPSFGDPIPVSRREPTLSQLGLEADIHYGLVGVGPTQLTNDLRFGIFDWWELRTSFAPYPSSLMTRFKLGSQQGQLGALVLDAGLAHFDAGFRIIPEENEPPVGLRAHLEVGLAYSRAFGQRFSMFSAARWRHRVSALNEDEQSVAALEGHLTWDVMPNLSLSGGIGYSWLLYGEVRELSVNFVEAGRPGLSHFLIRGDDVTESLTIPMSLTYGMVDTFDVDVFAVPRVFPQVDVLFGAGVRVRLIDVGASLTSLFGGGSSSTTAADASDEG